MTPLFKALLTDRPVAYYPMLAKALQSVTAGLFLSQLLYWSDKGADAAGWVWKTQEDWENETGLTRYEQEGARKRLRSLGVIKEERRGLPARQYFQVDCDVLEKLLGEKPQSIYAVQKQ